MPEEIKSKEKKTVVKEKAKPKQAQPKGNDASQRREASTHTGVNTRKMIDLPGKKESRLKVPKIRKDKPEKKTDKIEQQKIKKFAFDDPYIVLRHVVMTEKAVRMVEAQNKLVFVVDKKFGKDEIRQAAATAFNAEILKVNTVIDQRGRKKAYIRFAKPGQAGDIAVRLGII